MILTVSLNILNLEISWSTTPFILVFLMLSSYNSHHPNYIHGLHIILLPIMLLRKKIFLNYIFNYAHCTLNYAGNFTEKLVL